MNKKKIEVTGTGDRKPGKYAGIEDKERVSRRWLT